MKKFNISYFFLVIVDADRGGNTCHTALFNIGGTTSTSRSWNILITQYACGDTDNSGYVYNIHCIILSNVYENNQSPPSPILDGQDACNTTQQHPAIFKTLDFHQPLQL